MAGTTSDPTIVSHLLFADDTLIFCGTELAENLHLKFTTLF